MSLGRAPQAKMDLAAFRLDEVETVRPGVFRYRGGVRAVLARLKARLGRAWPRTNPEAFERPSNRA